MNLVFPLIGAICGVAGIVIAAIAYISTHRTDEGTLAISQRVAEVNELSALNEALGRDLERTQGKINELEQTVDRGRRKARDLEDQVTVALANVGILLAFIDEHVPATIQRPRLREVRTNGR